MHRFAVTTRTSLALAAIACSLSSALASEEKAVDFDRDVRPILTQHCVGCHGPAKRESGLRLDSGAAIHEGGDSGPAMIPGQADRSRLIQAVTGSDDAVSKMPPDGPGLAGHEIQLLRRWIEQGSQVPPDTAAEDPRTRHWSFQAARRPAIPTVGGRANNPIDSLIVARLESEQIAPSPEAERRTLMRRVTLDLLGVVPHHDEVDAFADDPRPDSLERLVDRQLASPLFGERWGRHWLDAARYADSNGYTRDFGREIWKYRDWVIGAFNRDLPFDQFTIEQIAGDMLPSATEDQLVATGFHRNTLVNEEGGTDPEQFRVDAVADRVSTTGEVFLGLTLGCARCHEHKYDPISQREYYELFAFLNNCDEPSLEVPDDWQIREGTVRRRDELNIQIAAFEKQLADKQHDFDRIQLEWEATVTPEQRVKLPGPTQEALMKQLASRTADEKKLVADVFKATDVARQAFPEVDQIARLRVEQPKIPTTLILRERSEPRVTHVHRRGNFLELGRQVEPHVPEVLHDLPAGVTSPSRLDLARWLVAPESPLTPRVTTNRFWQELFGRGLVETENDFGLQGSAPTHPELLDYLASEFIEQQWSVKQSLRAIVSSATYRQSSSIRAELAEIDPANLLLARQSRLRLDAEVIRDSALSASGLLTATIGGPSVFPPQPEGVFEFTQDPKPWKAEVGRDRFRRGMYTHFWRSAPYPSLMVFDFPNSNVTCTRRVRSNTPLQSLTLANDVQFVECARALAVRTLVESQPDTAARAVFAFRTALVRQPTDLERERIVAVVQNQQIAFAADAAAARDFVGGEAAVLGQLPSGVDMAEVAAWTAIARILLNVDEFVTRE